MKKNTLLLLIALINTTIVVSQTPGSLDTSFGTSGKVLTDLYGYQEVYDVAVQTDGKIVSVGRSKNGTDTNFAIYRHLANGTLDTSFGTNGGVYVDIKGTNRYDQANVLVIQPDGKIVVAGSGGLETNNGNCHFAFIRLNTNGTLDTTFGTNGKTSFPVGNETSNPNNRVFAMKLQSDGKIVAVGKASNSSSFSDYGIVRLNTDGSLDTDFSNDGKYTIDFGYVFDEALNFSINPSNGKILIAGETAGDLGLVSINEDGSLDNSFGTNGKITVDTNTGPLFFTGVNFQPDNKILVSGYESSNVVVYRINLDGTFDTSFGTNGKVTTDLDGGSTDKASKSIVIQPTGEFIVIGETNTGSTNYFAVLRYTSQGQLDTTFSSDGIVLTNFGPGFNSAQGAILQPDGKLLVVGFSGFTGQTALALARYNTGVNLDNETYQTKKLNLYPNPSSETIAIDGNFEENTEFVIYDSLGKEVLKGSNDFTNLLTIDVSNLKKGIYFVSIKDFETLKFIKN